MRPNQAVIYKSDTYKAESLKYESTEPVLKLLQAWQPSCTRSSRWAEYFAGQEHQRSTPEAENYIEFSQ